MKLLHLLSAASAVVLYAGVAQAQDAPGMDDGDPNTSVSGPIMPDQKRSVQDKADDLRGTIQDDSAPAAESYGTNVSATTPVYSSVVVTNGPVPDTAENRRRYGGPMSRAGRATAPRGN